MERAIIVRARASAASRESLLAALDGALRPAVAIIYERNIFDESGIN